MANNHGRSQGDDGSGIRAEKVKGQVDGNNYTTPDEMADAMEKWGVDLVDLDQDTIVTGKPPKKLKVRAKDFKEDKRLAGTAVGYLIRYGFVEAAVEKTEEELNDADTVIGERDLEKALRKMQKFYGLEVTGEADSATLNLMKKKRCGAKDMEYEKPNRAKRYTLSRKRWGVNTLNYWFDPNKYSADLSVDDIRSEFHEALAKWAAVSHVNFVEVANAEDAHIQISWEYGDHNDGYPFYGPGGTLAHAFYPTRGLLHFDDAEDFTKGTVLGTNLKYVATHEMGHILGLKHADNSLENAIMYALYTGYSDDLQLHQDDIDGAVAAMGAGSGSVSPLGEGGKSTETAATQPTPTPGPVPPSCIEKIDAAINWDYGDGYVYVFAGDWYYRLVPKNPAGGNYLPVVDSTTEPKKIGIDGFPGIPRNLDAAVETLENANRFYAFKGDRYYLYDFVSGAVEEEGSLSDLWSTDTPTYVHGAFKINNYNLGFISEDRLYKYNKDSGWLVGDAGSNYFGNYTDLDSISLAFYRSWAWVFRGKYYTVARSKTGVPSSNYVLRLIAPDIKLPMCTEGVDLLSEDTKRKCKKQLKKMKKKKGNYEPTSECKDFVAEKYTEEVEFDKSHFD
ncbi:hypothetical protein ACHWQZ_G018685 [Mnemiopsis leidyi]